MKRLVFTLISTLFFCLLLMAEDGTNKHVTKWLQLDQGLSNNFIVSLDIDRYGVLWIGTEEGMNRFDGVSVSSFTKYSGVLPGNELNRVVSDRYGLHHSDPVLLRMIILQASLSLSGMMQILNFRYHPMK